MYYETKVIATILERTQGAVSYMIRKGYLKGEKNGRDYRVSQKDFDDFLKNYFHTERKSNKGKRIAI